MQFEIRKDGRDIGITDDYETAAQFYAGGYDVTGFSDYYRTTNEVK